MRFRFGRSALAGAMLLTLAVMSPGLHATAASRAPWSAAWAMVGHDPQRTAQGAGIGPQGLTTPHLVLKGLDGDPPVVGADGTLYGAILSPVPRNDRVVAVSAVGHIRWTAAVPSAGDLVLAPTGRILSAGAPGACAGDPLLATQGLTTPGCLVSLAPNGRPQWHAVTQFLTKDIPQPLVRPDGSLVRATVGPNGYPIQVYSSAGVADALGASCSWAATALGTDNELYAAIYDNGSNGVADGFCPAYSRRHGLNGSSIVAFTATGGLNWITPLPLGCAASGIMVDTWARRIVVAAFCKHDTGPGQARVYTLDTRGRLLWVLQALGNAAAPAIALDRTTGDIWVADTAGLRRVSANGTVRRRISWPATANLRVVLVLDARGTAYIFSNGVLRAISPTGKMLWRYHLTAPATVTSAPLGPDGKLYVSGEGGTGTVVFAP